MMLPTLDEMLHSAEIAENLMFQRSNKSCEKLCSLGAT